ncbi:hypothetical protein ABT392_08235 [Paucibacter sp. JuS9]|uniref:hypothetical protein n=1 Tax=Paucibacter sp. JuS9 TaxID=3228748 RepID=UPI0037564BFC
MTGPERASDDDGAPNGLRLPAAAIAACRHALDAPPDLPTADRALQGLAIAIRSLAARIPAAVQIAARIEQLGQQATLGAAAGATILSLNRRTGRHLLYSIALKIGSIASKGQACDEAALQTFGAWLLRRLFDPWAPTGQAIANVDAALSRPDSDRARSWTNTSRTRALERALRSLEVAIADHPVVAVDFGLAVKVTRAVRTLDSTDLFNVAFRRRADNLLDFSTRNAVAAAGGYGTLSESALKVAGRELIERIRTGDSSAALVALEIVTHLTSDITLMLPVQVGDMPPERALAWLDVRGGSYCYVLYRLIDRGARPAPGTEHLYLETTQTIRVKLTEPLQALLFKAMDASRWTATTVRGLLGDVGHHPRASVVESGAYRCTARRLQESVPALLLQAGFHRWPVALLTNSHFLVSRGKPAYGTCDSHAVHEIGNAANRLLDWPTSKEPPLSSLIGSFTSPKATTIAEVSAHLAEQADQSSLERSGRRALITRLNKHAIWLAFFLSFVLALRNWQTYEVSADEVERGDAVHIDDKAVHRMKGLAVPIAKILHRVLACWKRLCIEAVAELKTLADSESLTLALSIERYMEDPGGSAGVFVVDAVGRPESIGTRSWREALPAKLRVRANFARHFWPLHLMRSGVEQLLIDVLMRHQMDGLHPGSSHSVRQQRADIERLRARMDEIIASLDLRMPSRLSGD